MKVKLYQIVPEKDDKNLMFMGYDFTMKKGGINPDIYKKVFEGELAVNNPDEVYCIFNTMLPDGYCGRCMSVSDIVYMDKLGTFFCDRFGWKEVEFTK